MRFIQVLLILISAAIIASFFLPYFSTGTDKDVAEITEEVKPFETVDVSAKDLINPSLFTYTKVYIQGGKEVLRNSSAGIVYGVLYCLIPFFGLLCFIFSLCNKAIPTLIFSILLGAAGVITQLDFKSRGISTATGMSSGIAYYIIYIGAALMFILSICLIVTKHSKKKQ